MTTTKLTALTTGNVLRIAGREFTVGHVVDMAKYPNLAAHIAASFELVGKRGASYSCDIRANGETGFYITRGRSARAVDFHASDVEVVS